MITACTANGMYRQRSRQGSSNCNGKAWWTCNLKYWPEPVATNFIPAYRPSNFIAEHSLKQTPKACIYCIDSDWQRAGGECPYCGIADIAGQEANPLLLGDASSMCWHQIGFCCSLADFCFWFLSNAKDCLSQSALEWQTFSPVAHLHPLLIFTSSSHSFLICRRCRCIEKDGTFILAEITYFFTVIWHCWSLPVQKSQLHGGEDNNWEPKGETSVVILRGLH